MKELRIQFSLEEYRNLKSNAEKLGVSVKELVHNRVVGIVTEETPLCSTKLLCDEMARYRQTLNQIIRRETEADARLYEDDIIRMEMTLSNVEKIVTAFVRTKLKETKNG